MSKEAAATAEPREFEAIDSSLMMKVFYAFAALAVLSVAISIAGKMLGRSIAMAGHTDDRSLRKIVIGNDVIAVPANAIRFERARRDGVASRLDLYLRWPKLEGYSQALRDDFNHAGESRSIIFVSFEERAMSLDMSGRFRPIYSALVEPPGRQGPAGLALFAFDERTGYMNEVLAVSHSDGETFVARCLDGALAEESLAPCERDVHVGNGLSLVYRFPRELLGDWRTLDAAIRGKAASMLRPGI